MSRAQRKERILPKHQYNQYNHQATPGHLARAEADHGSARHWHQPLCGYFLHTKDTSLQQVSILLFDSAKIFQ
jgi:hypothetical protein